MKRGSSATAPCMTTLTRHLVSALQSGETKVHDLQRRFGMTSSRRLYTVLQVLQALNCVERTATGEYQWTGSASVARKTLYRLRVSQGTRIFAQVRGMEARAEVLLRLLAGSAEGTPYCVKQISHERALYDVVNVLCGVGLLTKARDGMCGKFRWTPSRLFDESTTPLLDHSAVELLRSDLADEGNTITFI